MSEGNPLDVDAAIFRTTLQKLAKENFAVVIREGLEIVDRFSLDPVIRYNGREYDAGSVPEEARKEILDAARKHDEAIKHLADSKYCDPTTNPMIRMRPDR